MINQNMLDVGDNDDDEKVSNAGSSSPCIKAMGESLPTPYPSSAGLNLPEPRSPEPLPFVIELVKSFFSSLPEPRWTSIQMEGSGSSSEPNGGRESPFDSCSPTPPKMFSELSITGGSDAEKGGKGGQSTWHRERGAFWSVDAVEMKELSSIEFGDEPLEGGNESNRKAV